MQIRGTAAGLVALALVLGGVFWVRLRPVPSQGAAAGQAASAPASHDEAPPDVTVADGVVDLGDLRVTLSVMPRPPVAFRQNRFRVRVDSTSVSAAADTSRGAPLALEGGRISFEMTMPMGEHRYSLARGEGGWQEAEVVLPFCKSGNPRWYAIVEGTVAGQPRTARFRLDLTQPGSAPTP